MNASFHIPFCTIAPSSAAPTRPEPHFKFAMVARIQGDVAKKDGKLDDAKKYYTEALDSIRQAIKYDDTEDARKGRTARVEAMKRGVEPEPVVFLGR